MTPLRLPLILAIAGLLAFGSFQAVRAQTLIVRLYDYADVSARDIASLTGTTGLVFSHSGITLVWRHCRGAIAVQPGAACEAVIQGNEIVLRLQPGGTPTSNQGTTLSLGHALIVDGGGSYANVFVPSVRAQSAEFGVAFDLLMGYTVAHEIGHCMLGPGHSYTGLMRGAWDLKDAGQMLRLGLRLTKQQARKAAVRLSLAEPAVLH